MKKFLLAMLVVLFMVGAVLEYRRFNNVTVAGDLFVVGNSKVLRGIDYSIRDAADRDTLTSVAGIIRVSVGDTLVLEDGVGVVGRIYELVISDSVFVLPATGVYVNGTSALDSIGLGMGVHDMKRAILYKSTDSTWILAD